MPTELQGTSYLTVNEVAEEVGVSRQTIWRWRKRGSVPQGNIARGRRILFSQSEVEAIRSFAEKVEPLPDPSDPVQPSLFERSWEP